MKGHSTLDNPQFAWDVDGDGSFDDAFGSKATIAWEMLEQVVQNERFQIGLRVTDSESGEEHTDTVMFCTDSFDFSCQ